MPRLSPLRIFGGFPGSRSEPAENESAARVPFGEISGFDSSTPCGSRGNRAQQAFNPLAEKEKNVGSDAAAERRFLPPPNPKLKFQWSQQQQQQIKNPLPTREDDARSDSEPIDQSATTTPSRRLYSVQQVTKHGGASQFSTPRSSKIENKYLQMHSEPGSNSGQVVTGTPKKSVSRTLKYNQDVSVRGVGGTIVKSLGFSHGKHGENLAPAQFELEEDLSFWQDHNVQVLIRIRPPSPLEISLQGPGRCLRQDSAHSLTWTGHPESRFTFDHVACESVNQEKLFRVAGLPMVENCIFGYNNCMFAYGQTGSGKTHTMLGDIDIAQSEERGMIPRVFEYLFVKIQTEEEARSHEGLEFVCKCSFLEIYNEQISDLLEPSSTNLQLREDVKKGVYVENLREVEVNSVESVMKLLLQGSANRRVAATNMNRESSRSHSVFTCVVESKWESDDSVINTRFGRLNLVDLAGSERQKSSGAEGDRLKEAANINKSLSTLGLVIMVLVDAANGKPRHVPYRDSKLTFLLQDSLGGNSKTMIIATASPSNSCALETLSTLKFAQRAKFICNNAIVNEDSFGDVVSLRQQIQQLKDEVNYLRNQDFRKTGDNEQPAEPPFLSRLGQDVLAASLKREAAAESVIKNLGVEISHLKRLVRQREEDTQRVKMLLRFREDRIRRLEAATNGTLTASAYGFQDREALLEELKVLGGRVDHNPEVTRFAMENIRLMEELKRFQEFYDQGERETMSTELSNLRDQLMEILEANATLKDECGVEGHTLLLQEVEKLRREASHIEDCKFKSLQEENVELVRENEKLQKQLAALLDENEIFRCNMELNTQKMETLEIDQEALIATIEGLKATVQQCEQSKKRGTELTAFLESCLKEAKQEIETLQANLQDANDIQEKTKRDNETLQAKLKDANDLQEQMENQQLIVINELEAVLLKQQSLEADNSVAVLKSQLQSLQLELQRKEEIRSLEKTAESLDEVGKLKVEQEVLKLREELEDAQELNRLFYRERVRRLSLDKQMDARRAEVEGETADTIANMQKELFIASDKFALASDREKNASNEMERLQLENARLTTYCENLKAEKNIELCRLWDQATSRIAEYLSEGDDTLNAAAREMEHVRQVPVLEIPQFAVEKHKIIEALQSKLQEAFTLVKEAECKTKFLNEAASEMAQRVEVLPTDPAAREGTSTAGDYCVENLQKSMDVAFVVMNNLSEAHTRTRTELEDHLRNRELEKARASALISSLRGRLVLSEKRGEAALSVVKHCVDVEDELRTDIDEASSIILDQQTAISSLQEKNGTDMSILEETQAKLEHAWKEITALKCRLQESEKLWCSEKEKLLLDVKELDMQAVSVAGQCASSQVVLLNQVAVLEQDLEESKVVFDEAFRCFSHEASATLHAFKFELVELRGIASRLKEANRLTSLESDTRIREVFRRLEVAETDIAAAESRCKDFSLKAALLEEELVPTKLALERSLMDNNEIKMKFDRLRESAEAEELRFQMALADAQEKLSTSQLRVGELSLELQRSQDRCEAVEKDCMASVAEMNELDIKIQELDDHIAHLEDENGALVKENESQASKIQGLETLRLELQQKVDSLVEDIQRKDDLCKALELSIQELTDRAQNMQDDTSQLHDEIKSKKDSVLQLQTVVRNVQEELSRSNHELAETGKELKALKDVQASTLIENSTLKSSIQRLEANVTSLEDLLNEKSHLLENLKVEVAEHCRQTEELEQQVAVVEQNAKASVSDYERKILQQIEKKDAVIKGLEFDMGLLQESFSEVTERKTEALESNAKLQEELSARLSDLSSVEQLLTEAREELVEKAKSLQLLEADAYTMKELKGSLETENNALEKAIQELSLDRDSIQNELDEKSNLVETLDLELLELSSLVEQKVAESVRPVTEELRDVLQERDRLNADLLVVTEQLEMAQSLADERELVAAEARKVAEASKAHAEEKDEEIKVLERSVGELESIVNALENQVGIIKREAQMQRLMREDLETEVQSLRHEITLRNGMIAANNKDEETTLRLKEEVARLSEDCFEKEAQIEAYKKHISDLMMASTRQTSQYQQKINELETFLDQAKSTKAKGSSSPFKCIGKGLSQQMNSEFDEELTSAKIRISELETIAAGRQREVFMLNARLAEAESMTHDVVRDLLGVKMDITNYALLQSILSEERRSDSPDQEEIQRLHKQLEAYIEERESCLEEIDHRQAEVVAIRVAAEKLRLREQTLTTENNKLKDEINGLRKHQSELETEVRKLSGQQNLQQRIHHHAKIKDENNWLKMKNEEITAKLRNTEARLNRVNDELTRFRNANGKPQYEVEQQLRSRLKEAQDDNLQMAQELTHMCKRIMEVASASKHEGDVDPSVALQSLEMLQHRLSEDEKQEGDLKLIVDLNLADDRRAADR